MNSGKMVQFEKREILDKKNQILLLLQSALFWSSDDVEILYVSKVGFS